MALPTTITGAHLERCHNPPYLVGSAVYVVAINASNNPVVYKATDPTVSFSEQDGSNRPTSTVGTGEPLSSYYDGSDIHITYWEGTAYRYSCFHTSTDLWDASAKDELIETPAIDPELHYVGISARSDGDVIVVYAGSRTGSFNEYPEAVYARRESGIWTAAISLDAAVNDSTHSPVIVKGSSDNMHIMWGFEDQTIGAGRQNIDARAKTLSSSNTLSSLQVLENVFGETLSLVNSVFVGDTGEILSLNMQKGGGQIRLITGSEDPSQNYSDLSAAGVTPVPNAGAEAIAATKYAAIGSMAFSGSTAHVFYKSQDTLDLYYLKTSDYGTTWSTPTQEAVLTDLQHVNCTVYQRNEGETVLAYIYDDNGTISYNEKFIGTEILLTTDSSAITEQPLNVNASTNINLSTEDLQISPQRIEVQADIDTNITLTTDSTAITSYPIRVSSAIEQFTFLQPVF